MSTPQPNYRSGFERKFHKLHPTAEFEPIRLPYVVTHHYTPDFVLPDGTLVECKGLWTGTDRQKHLYIKKQHPERRVIFCFENANRKLGPKSKVTYADWCTKHGFTYYTLETFPKCK